jgi:carbohydrate-selective porin OprB
MMKPTRSPIDMTNQKLGLMGSAADGMRALSAITVGTIPAISRFIDSSSDMNVLLTITLNYTHDFLANVRGGIGPGAVGTGIFQPQLDLDLKKLVGWEGGKFHTHGLITHGPLFSPTYL